MGHVSARTFNFQNITKWEPFGKKYFGKGCRQGDLISPYLFVLAAEFLLEAIRMTQIITGIKFYEQEHKVLQHTDDTTLF